MTQTEFIRTFNAFPTKDRLAIAKKIQLQMADELFDELDAELPDVEISMSEIQKEIKAFRNAQKKKN
ncbi:MULTISPECIES: hypothetical protein [Runella]|jgi:hypothetical protein|uniref:Uncharacterized protein n=2 Tax=Runella TaxID=105 RepID=A0A369IDS0_9BACT|nr:MULTISPECIES: hypothetical protein [Runella]MCP1385847.1 hypothetical protein [Runella salmonicolor]RDB06980.1 hypothetical protein DVG78_06810 [Runella aurantiaca]